METPVPGTSKPAANQNPGSTIPHDVNTDGAESGGWGFLDRVVEALGL